MRLTNHDASFLYTETASGPMHTTAISVLEGKLDFQTYLEHIRSRLHLAPSLRKRLAFVPFNLAHPKWVDDPHFKLANHIKHHQLPQDSNVDAAIAKAVRLAEPTLPRNRPLWQIYVLTGLPDRTILLSMFHHALIDGASGVDLSMILTDLQPNAAPPPPPAQAWQPEPVPTPLELATEAAKEMTRQFAENKPIPPESLGAEHSELLRRASESMTRFLAEPVITAPWNAASVGPKRHLSWRKFSFSEFREIRRAFGGTINDVVLTVVAESAARYLKTHNESIEGQHIRVMCPVNVRREDEKGTLGNRVSGIYPVFSAEPMNVRKRYQRVRLEMDQIKQNREAQAMELMSASTPYFPPIAMVQTQLIGTGFDPTAMAAAFPLPVPPQFGPRMPLLGFNFTCTNVPGVQVPQYVAGHEVLDSFGVLMLSGTMGYGVAIGSYNQHLTFSFVCEPRLMPDVELMATGVEDAFHELLQTARSESHPTE